MILKWHVTGKHQKKYTTFPLVSLLMFSFNTLFMGFFITNSCEHNLFKSILILGISNTIKKRDSCERGIKSAG